VVLEKDGEDRVRNEEVLHTVKEVRNILVQQNEDERLFGLVTSCLGTCLPKHY
jgi:hypothetical protein